MNYGTVLYQKPNLIVSIMHQRNTRPRTGKPCPKCGQPSRKQGFRINGNPKSFKHQILDVYAVQRYKCPECNIKWCDAATVKQSKWWVK